MIPLPLRAGSTSQILLYHATFSSVPQDLMGGLHNVTPPELERQLAWLKRHFRFIAVDEWFEARNREGTAVVTFDDAYNCVFEEALPVLESLDIPATIFVNGTTLDGGHFWRDKIRYIVARKLVPDFLEWLPTGHPLKSLGHEDAFYRQTKSPRLNSRMIDAALDGYMTERGLRLPVRYCADGRMRLIAHPLLSYGNHTYSHYVLSALTREEQAEEIGRNHDLLRSLDLPICEVLSVPFGGREHFNRDTLDIAHQLGYRGYLLARNRLNNGSRKNQTFPMEAAERYMPPPSLPQHRRLVLKLAYFEPVRRRFLASTRTQ